MSHPGTVTPELVLDRDSAFELAPVGLVMSRHRLVVDCNQSFLAMFRLVRDDIIGKSFATIYPTADEFQRMGSRIAASLGASNRHVDERLMRRAPGDLFWCRVSGRALDPANPHVAAIWSFEDLSPDRAVSLQLTPREREVAALLIQGLSSKLIGRQLGISHRTVEIYRRKLMAKYEVTTAAELLQKLLRTPEEHGRVAP